MNLAEIVVEIDAALDTWIAWEVDHAVLAEHKAAAWTGVQIQNDGGGWKFLVVEYPDPEAPNEMLAHGSATRLGSVVFLTPELAAKALERAKAS